MLIPRGSNTYECNVVWNMFTATTVLPTNAHLPYLVMGQFIPEPTSKAYSSNDAIQNLTNRLVA